MFRDWLRGSDRDCFRGWRGHQYFVLGLVHLGNVSPHFSNPMHEFPPCLRICLWRHKLRSRFPSVPSCGTTDTCGNPVKTERRRVLEVPCMQQKECLSKKSKRWRDEGRTSLESHKILKSKFLGELNINRYDLAVPS